MTDSDTPRPDYPERDGRVFVKFHADDAAEVSVPGYLDARPGLIRDGDVFSVPVEFAADVLGAGSERFELIDPPAREPEFVDASGTIAEILDQLPEGEVRDAAPKSPKDAVVAYVDDYLRAHPPVPAGNPDPASGEPVDANDASSKGDA